MFIMFSPDEWSQKFPFQFNLFFIYDEFVNKFNNEQL